MKKKKKLPCCWDFTNQKKNCVITTILKKLDLSDGNYLFGLCKLLKYNAIDIHKIEKRKLDIFFH